MRLALLLPYVLERRRELALLLVGRLACRLERLLLLAPQVLDRGRVLLAQLVALPALCLEAPRESLALMAQLRGASHLAKDARHAYTP